MTLYQLEHIQHRYESRLALSPALSIDRWSVAEGAITGLCGPNGSGKSTLLKLLGFIERPSQGEIYLQGRKADMGMRGVRDHVTLLPQESYLLKRNVYKNIAYGLRLRKDRSDEARRVHQALDLVGLAPDRFALRPWYALSGGEARRVALAARLVLKPKVLLLDEPTTSVDAASAQQMKAAALHAHRQWGSSLVISSHDVQWLQDICHDIVYVFNGRILGQGQRALLFGPWQRLEGNRVGRRLAEDQIFVAGNPPDEIDNAVAVIDPTDLSLHPSDQNIPDGMMALKGLLTRLALENATGRIRLAVAVGHTEFTASLPADTLAAENYRPGKEIWIAYRPDEVTWY